MWHWYNYYYDLGFTSKKSVIILSINERIKNFLLARDRFMPEMQLWQPGFSYSACGPFTKNKERIQRYK